MTKQFFGKRTGQALLLIVILHVMAIFAWQMSIVGVVALVVVGLAAFALSLRSLPLGLLIAFGEIFVGGHGHLVDATIGSFSLSLRMVIFLVVMFAWFIGFLKKRLEPKLILSRDIPWFLLIAAVLLGTITGLLFNQTALVLDDMNSFVVIAYLLPIASIAWDNTLRRELLQVLTASALWLMIVTMSLSFIFTHFSGDVLDSVYRFVRDTRLFEVTLLTVSDLSGNVQEPWLEPILGADGYWFRIFTPAHFFVGVLLIILLSLGWYQYKRQRFPELAQFGSVLAAATLLLSYSRSLWLGMLAGIGAVKLAYWGGGERHGVHFIRRGFLYLGILVVGAVFTWGTIALPFPPRPDLSDAAFFQTSSDVGRDSAVSSRWSMLAPIMSEIQVSPIIGRGFGREVTFVSDDPRVREQSASGEWTAFRFEWGWLDVWLKMGLLGLVAFSWYAVSMFQAIRYSVRQHGHAWLPVALGAGLVVLYITNIFTPYLNHPIGLGFMLFVLPFLDFDERKAIETATEIRAKQKAPRLQKQEAGITASN